MSYYKFYLVDRKYGYDQFDPIDWSMMNPEIKFQEKIIGSLDRMMVATWKEQNIDVHPTFVKQLGIQISKEAERILGIKGLQKKGVFIDLFGTDAWLERHDGKPINKDGYSYFLVRIETKRQLYCHCAMIRWKSLKKDVPYIALNGEVGEDTIRFEICEEYGPEPSQWPYYPKDINRWIQSLREELEWQERNKKGKKKRGVDYRFEYEVMCGWPDVFFQIQFNKSVTEKEVNQVEVLIRDFSNDWNDSPGKRDNDDMDDNIIDYVGSTEPEEDQKTVDIHVDFGTSDPETVLPALLKSLNDSDLDIKSVVLR